MVAAIILAAGRGTRIKSRTVNKVTLPFLGKPMIRYGVDLLRGISEKIVVVVGAFSPSVMDVLNGQTSVIYAYQKKRLGTAHAVKIGLSALSGSPSLILVGMGDHLMFYKKSTIKKLIDLHKSKGATISFITTHYDDPDELAWGRIIRDERGNIRDVVEQKDANSKQKKIKELNAGFYCFDHQFLKKNIEKIKKSPVTGEYYLPEMIEIAKKQNKKIVGMPVRFREVGIGVNHNDELNESQALYRKFH